MVDLDVAPIKVKLSPIKTSFTAIVAVIFTFLLSALLFFVLPAMKDATDASRLFGESTGGLAGTAAGAFDALLNIHKTTQDTIEDTLSDSNVDTEIATQISGAGKLEVLSAKITARDVEVDGKVYASYSIVEGEAIFTVDLSKLNEGNVQETGSEITVVLPEPHVSLRFDYENKKKIAEYKNNILVDTALASKDLGIVAHQNSIINTVEDAQKEIANFDFLVDQARESARHQVEQLVKNIRGESYKVKVIFQGKVEKD